MLANRKRALRGRADRDVVEGAAVGVAGRDCQGHRDGQGVHQGPAVAVRNPRPLC